MNTRSFSLLTLTVCSLALALVACGAKDGGAPPPAAAAAAPPPMEVDVISVDMQSVTVTQDLPGRLEAYRSAQVRARVEGIVEKRMFEEGTDVKAGETLFLIDARNFRAANDSAKTDLALAKQTVERYKPLLEAKAVSQQEYDAAEAKLKQAETAMARAQLDYDNTHVPAPISGRIGRAQVTEGALIGRGEATLLATIEQVDPIYVTFSQAGSELFRLTKAIKSGKFKHADSTKVELMQDDGSLYPQPGKLMFSNLAVDASTGSVSLRALFPNPKHELLPGMFVRIRFPEAVSDNAIKVPQRAVIMNTQGQFVMVVDQDSKVAMRPVKVGDMAGTDFIIEDGLKPGDQVIVNGLQKVKPGAVVKAVEWNPAAPAAAAPAASAPASTEKK